MDRSRYRFAKLIGIVFILYALFQFIRANIIYRMGYTYDFIQSSSIDNWFYIFSVFAIIMGSVGFLLLLLEMDERTIREKNATIEAEGKKLRALNATKDKFFSIIAHDLRNPFGVITGYLDLAQETIQEATTRNSAVSDSAPPAEISLPSSLLEELKDSLDQANRGAENAYRLLENLLEWALSQEDTLVLHPEKINLSEAIAGTVKMVRGSLDRKGIRLQVSVGQELELFADRNMLKTILLNLLTNAVKYTRAGGNISIRVSGDQHSTQMVVQDNGVGISLENQSRIFSGAGHLSTTGTANEKGTGLGLMLIQELVEKHHGSIEVKSEPDVGTVFTVTFPTAGLSH